MSYEAMEHIMKTAVDDSDDIKEDLRKREGAFGMNADVDVVDVCDNVHEIGCDAWTGCCNETISLWDVAKKGVVPKSDKKGQKTSLFGKDKTPSS